MRSVARNRGLVRGGAVVGRALVVIAAHANRRRFALTACLLVMLTRAASGQGGSPNGQGVACKETRGNFVRPTPVVQGVSTRVARFENAVRWRGKTAIVGTDMPYFGEPVSDSLLFAHYGDNIGAPRFDGWYAMPRIAAADSSLVLVWGEPTDTSRRRLAFVPTRLSTLWAATFRPRSGWAAPEKLLAASEIGVSSGNLVTSAKTGRVQVAVPVFSESARQRRVVFLARDAKGWRHTPVPGTDGAVSSALTEARDGTIILAFVASDPSLTHEENSLFITTSSNGGVNWSAPQVVTHGGVRDPVVLVGPDGQLHVLWRQTALREDGVDVIRHVASLTLSQNHVWSDPSDLHARAGFFRFTSVIDGCGTVHVVYEDWHGGGDVGDVDYAALRNGSWSEPVHVLPGWLSIDPFLMLAENGEISLFLLGYKGTAPKGKLANYQLFLE